jgi:hypothetical protein
MPKVSKRDPCGELPSYFENYTEKGKKLDVAAFSVPLVEERKLSPPAGLREANGAGALPGKR